MAAERSRLIRLCARLTGDWEAAEDLAQDTLAEAWRMLARLRDADGLSPWLTAIARNVCLRWQHDRGREIAYHVPLSHDADQDAETLDELTGADEGADLILEREELVELLERALALLPAASREALLASYVQEMPRAELAARLGLGDGALRAHLHRARVALRHVLTTELRDDALALGMDLPEAPVWRETRIWCPFCGRHRILVRADRRASEYEFRCAGNCAPGIQRIAMERDTTILEQLSSPKSILTRLCLRLSTGYRDVLVGLGAECPLCGRAMSVEHYSPDRTLPSPLYLHGIRIACMACGRIQDDVTPWHLTLDTPAAMRFWRRHPRMRAMRTYPIERDGRAALVTGFESLESSDRLEVVSTYETYELLHVAGEPRT